MKRDVAREAGFSKIHAFPFSPREGTAAARWQEAFVDPALVRDRMDRLAELERTLSLAFRRRFLGSCERVIVENGDGSGIAHGRCDRYFSVHFEAAGAKPGDLVTVRIDRVTPTRTHGTRIDAREGTVPLPVWSEQELPVERENQTRFAVRGGG